MLTVNTKLYSDNKTYPVHAGDTEGAFHTDRSVPRNIDKISGFASGCKGCQHIRSTKEKGKHCVYIYAPALKSFPCYFRDNVEKGGWDGKYGATVNNYVRKPIKIEGKDQEHIKSEKRRKGRKAFKLLKTTVSNKKNWGTL